MQRNRDTGIFLLGTHASGKGQVGNFLLGFPAFHTTSNTTPATPVEEAQYSTLNGRVIAVIESPDIRTHPRTNCQNFVNAMESFLYRVSVQIRVFLLVLRYNVRLTIEDMQMIQSVEKLLGENLLRDHTHIIITGGNEFERCHRIEDFHIWCGTQPDENLRALMRECQGRAHLFGNKSKLETDLLGQQQQLMDSIDRLSEQHGSRGYSMQDYQIAHYSRQKEIVSLIKEEVEKETHDTMCSIMNRLDCIRRQLEPSEQLARLGFLLLEAEELISRVQRYDRETGILSTALQHAEVSRRSVQDAKGLCYSLVAFDQRLTTAERSISRHDKCIILFAGVCVCLLICFYIANYGSSFLDNWLFCWMAVFQSFISWI